MQERKAMKKFVRDLWTKALLGDEYVQGTGCLWGKLGMCCLGVLTDLWVKHAGVCGGGWSDLVRYNGVHEFNEDIGWLIEDTSSYLPKCVMEWAGLEDNDPILHGCMLDGSAGAPTCSWRNDHGTTFKQMVELIEKHIPVEA